MPKRSPDQGCSDGERAQAVHRVLLVGALMMELSFSSSEEAKLETMLVRLLSPEGKDYVNVYVQHSSIFPELASAWVLESRHAESVSRFSSLCVTYQKHSPSERPDLLQLKPSLILTWKAGTGGMNPKIPWFFSWLAAKNLKNSTQSLVLGAYFNFCYWGGIPSRRSLKSLA